MFKKTSSQQIPRIILIFFVIFSISACKENIDMSARYVFKEDTVISYLQKFPNKYSSYLDLLFKVKISKLSESSVGQLLTARGCYTAFAPTNEAIDSFLVSLVNDGLISEPTWESFTDSIVLDSIRKVIVFNSIIDSGDTDGYFETSDFPMMSGEEFTLANLNDRKMSVRYVDDPDSIYINIDCPVNVKNRDIYVTNGIIHQMDKVIAPKSVTAADYLHDIISMQKDGFLVMARAIQACGLLDTLRAERDETYEKLYQLGKIEDLIGMTSYGFAEGSVGYAPKHRLFGFTIFAETDDFWKEQGLDPKSDDLLERLTTWIFDNHQYSDDDTFVRDNKYTKEENLLYQWVTYHILPMKLGTNKLVIHRNEYGYSESARTNYTIPVYEYYTSFGPRRLIKLYESKASKGVYINRFPIIDNKRTGTGLEIGCDADKVGSRIGNDDERMVVNDIVNACIYPIDAPISYNTDVRNNLAKQRIRFDGMSLFPEAMNNDIRCKASSDNRNMFVLIPKTSVYPYFENLTINDDCNFVYFNSYKLPYPNLNIDEIKAVGRYELTFKLPPVPRRGTYEFRYDVLANPKRGVAQCYFGSNLNNLPVTGIPLDLTLRGDDISTGWENDSEDQDYNAEVDKRMRNNGFMKGVKSIIVYGTGTDSERDVSHSENARRILLRTTLDPKETYYLKVKSVLDSDRKEFYMDYLEYCPKEIYDNPNEQEDIW